MPSKNQLLRHSGSVIVSWDTLDKFSVSHESCATRNKFRIVAEHSHASTITKSVLEHRFLFQKKKYLFRKHFCKGWNSNCRLQVLQATGLSTVPQFKALKSDWFSSHNRSCMATASGPRITSAIFTSSSPTRAISFPDSSSRTFTFLVTESVT